jgi:hypothetical protein
MQAMRVTGARTVENISRIDSAAFYTCGKIG